MTIKERNHVEGLARAPGLTWRHLASRMGKSDRRGQELPLPAGPGRRRGPGRSANPDPNGQGG